MAQSLQTDRTRPADLIMDHYRSDSPGVRANIYRLLNTGRLAGTGKLVILPVDQGFEHGPARSFAANPAGYDPEYHVQLAIEAGCNAYAAPYGFIQTVAHDYAGKIPLILEAVPMINCYKLSSTNQMLNYLPTKLRVLLQKRDI